MIFLSHNKGGVLFVMMEFTSVASRFIGISKSFFLQEICSNYLSEILDNF